MNNVNLTEQDVMDKLISRAKAFGEVSPRAIIVNRLQGDRSLQRTVRIALVVTTNNEALLEVLIQETISNNLDFSFVGSDVNLQSDLEVDYLFFEAKIMYKNGGQN